jgi:hypothetical protein
MQLASTSPNFMWVTSTGAINYVDVSDGQFKRVAHLLSPGTKNIPPQLLDKILREKFSSIEKIEEIVKNELGVDWTRITNNIYSLVDKNNVLYASAGANKVFAYGLTDASKPSAGIKILRTLDFSDTLKKVAEGSSESLKQYGARIAALNMTYDGKLIVVSNRSVTVLETNFEGPQQTIEFGKDEFISNSIAVDDKNGIYIASDKMMHKVVWTGSKLSTDEKDGARSAPYQSGTEPPSVKLGIGTGSTPTLMGFGQDSDKLVVITNGADRMNLVAFWRDEIPKDFKQIEGAKSKRIAGQIPVTAGLSPLPKYIQSEQSVVVDEYGAFVVNNIRKEGRKDKLVDVLAGGPVFTPGTGVERFEWDVKQHQWRSIWSRGDVISASMVPAVSTSSGIVFVNGYTSKDGWELTGLDWKTGKTVHRSIFGQDNLGNGAYALIQFLSNGDLLFNSVGGAIRVHYPTASH